MSLSELETIHHLCELEPTQIIQSLDLEQYLKYFTQEISHPVTALTSLTMKETIFGIILELKFFTTFCF